MAHDLKPPTGSASGATHRRYFGGCECRIVRYTVELDIAARDVQTGSVWEHSARPSSFRLMAGQESVIGYQFAAEDAHHFFCVGCSTRVFSLWAPEGAARYSVDLKSLYGAELGTLETSAGHTLRCGAGR